MELQHEEATPHTKLSEDHRRKIAEGNRGKVISEETRRKMSANHKGMLGKKHSEEARRKISESLKGNTYARGNRASDERRRQISEFMKGNTYGKALRGTKRSQETRRKISEAHLGKKLSSSIPPSLTLDRYRESKRKCLRDRFCRAVAT